LLKIFGEKNGSKKKNNKKKDNKKKDNKKKNNKKKDNKEKEISCLSFYFVGVQAVLAHCFFLNFNKHFRKF